MSSCEVNNLKDTQMETPNEYLKRISPNDKYGIREHLQKERLRGVVENIMQKYAEYYHQQQLLIHSVVRPNLTDKHPIEGVNETMQVGTELEKVQFYCRNKDAIFDKLCEAQCKLCKHVEYMSQ